jgi:hypothetical protein
MAHFRNRDGNALPDSRSARAHWGGVRRRSPGAITIEEIGIGRLPCAPYDFPRRRSRRRAGRRGVFVIAKQAIVRSAG